VVQTSDESNQSPVSGAGIKRNFFNLRGMQSELVGRWAPELPHTNFGAILEVGGGGEWGKLGKLGVTDQTRTNFLWWRIKKKGRI
jgi:hypothetical protein